MNPINVSQMKVLVFGAGTIGSYYTYRLHEAGIDVTLLARGERYEFLKSNGVQLVDEITKRKYSANVNVIDHIDPAEVFDFVVVIVRKNAHQAIIAQLGKLKNLTNIVFLGNNVKGFESYTKYIEREKLFFGFPHIGGTVKNQIVSFTENIEKKKTSHITIGEMDGSVTTRLKEFKILLTMASFKVDIVNNIDGWLKYHAAFVIPICHSLYKHNCDNYEVAKSKETLLELIKAAKECGDVLSAIGYKKRYPFKFNLFYWLPEKMTVKVMQSIFDNEYARVTFTLHASSAVDEFQELTADFYELIQKSKLKTPFFDKLSTYIQSPIISIKDEKQTMST